MAGCQANAQVVVHTGFTQAECTNFAALYNALVAAAPAVTYAQPVLCATNSCNAILITAHASGAPRAAAGAAALAALALAALL